MKAALSADDVDSRRADIEAYLAHIRNERRLSANTLRNYAHALDALLELNPGTSLDELTHNVLRRNVAQLHARGLSGPTLAQTLSAWRGLYRWLARYRGLAANPCADIRAPKAPKRLPKALSPEMAQQLLDEAPGDVGEIRDKAMFELLYSSGLRLAELIGLEFAGAASVIQDGEVTVTGKGAKTRTIPVGAAARQALTAWMAVRSSLARPDETALFVGSRGARIAPRVVQQRLARWSGKCGIGVHVHPHVLRHSFASHVLQSSSDLRAVQDMLGHSSISTTQIYTSLDFQHLAKVYDAAHPRAKKTSQAPAKGDSK